MNLSARQNFMLAVLASVEEAKAFSPVQIQKLFFLLDQEAGTLIHGPYFRFVPYDYGPFDRAAYDELDYLSGIGLVRITEGRYRLYSLSSEGYLIGRRALSVYQDNIQSYFTACAKWVLSLNFDQLVAAIYNKYPEMRVNSVFKR